MRRSRATTLFAASLLAVFSLACSSPPEEPAEPAPSTEAPADGPATPAWFVEEGMAQPESAYLHADSGALFVSLIDGEPGGRDGNGHIARLTPEGEVVDAMWATGFNAPKGLRAHDGTLWVADLDEVIGIDIETAEVTSRIAVEGAEFLNDVATGPDGTVYVSDSNGLKIYAIADGEASVFAEGDVVEAPNGVLVDGDRLLVGSMRQAAAPDSAPGQLFALDLASGEKTVLSNEPIGTIDGIELDGQGGYILTNVMAGEVVHVSGAGDVRVIMNFGDSVAADHAYDSERGHVIVPHLFQSSLGAYDVSGLLD